MTIVVRERIGTLSVLVGVLAASGCSSANGEHAPDAAIVDARVDAPAPVGAFSIGGTVTGLMGTGLVVAVNGSDGLALKQNGAFTFPDRLPYEASYAVAVVSQPRGPIQTCVVARGKGILAGDVSDVALTCGAPGYTLGGTVEGLAVRSGGGRALVLETPGAPDLELMYDGPFTFDALLQAGTTYDVTVKTQPDNQTCVVDKGSGSLGAYNMTSVSVSCADARPLVGYTYGLGPFSSVVLENEGANPLTVTGGYNFSFPGGVEIGGPFDVTVSTQPSNPAQTCTITGGTGTMGSTGYNGINLTCTPEAYGVYIYNSGNSKPINVYDNGVLAFVAPAAPLTLSFGHLPQSVLAGTPYDFTIDYPSPAPGERCSLPPQSGTFSGNQDIHISCIRTCQTILEDAPSSPSGMYSLYAGSGDALEGYCDMTFDGGGWTLIASTAYGNGPEECSWNPLPVTPGSCVFLPGDIVRDLASISSQVHVRVPGVPMGTAPTTYITSVPGALPIQNLVKGVRLDFPESELTAQEAESYWTVVGMSPTILDPDCYNYQGWDQWPSVYLTCQSTGFNMYYQYSSFDSDSHWGVSTPLEVYVR